MLILTLKLVFALVLVPACESAVRDLRYNRILVVTETPLPRDHSGCCGSEIGCDTERREDLVDICGRIGGGASGREESSQKENAIENVLMFETMRPPTGSGKKQGRSNAVANWFSIQYMER